MDTFDYVIMGVGGTLIIVGLFLYVSGKKDKESASNLEGFGIKLNVSNPSILLIVVGVLLLLVPRFFPQSSSPAYIKPVDNKPIQPDPFTGQVDTTDTKPLPAIQPTTQPEKEQLVQNAFLPTGNWQLNSYSEHGIDLTANVRGTMNFTPQSPQSVQWISTFVSEDLWGNTYNYNYQGQISQQNNIYTLDITASNDPNFIRQAPVPLELMLEDGGLLHMRYFYQGTEILLHWQQY